jgi:glycosyltransferase involved in cell wall biosynthesis
MNNHTLQPGLSATGYETHRKSMRVVTLCGSIKPLFSGTDDFNDILIRRLRAKGVDARPIEMPRWGLAQVPKLLQRVAAERPDVILMQYPTDGFRASLGPHAFSALQRHAPLVVTLHEVAATHPIRRISLSVLLARSVAVVTTAEEERNALLTWYPWLRHRTCMIPIAANIHGLAWQPSPRSVVVYFGQIRPEKGIEEFIACHDIVAPRFPKVEFIIAGSRVPKFQAYHKAIQAETHGRGIHLRGELHPDQVAEFLRTATVALLPFPSGASWRRGSLLAAAACGVPIVTLHGDDTPPDIANLLSTACSRDELVSQLTDCLSNPAEREAAHERSCRLAALVSWDAVSDRYLELLGRLAAQRYSP